MKQLLKILGLSVIVLIIAACPEEEDASTQSYIFNFNWNYEGTSYSEVIQWVPQGTSIRNIEDARDMIDSFIDKLGIQYILQTPELVSLSNSYTYEEVYEIILTASKLCWNYNSACKGKFTNENWLADNFYEGDFVLNGRSSIDLSTYASYPYFISVRAVFADDIYVYWWVLVTTAASVSSRSLNKEALINHPYKLIEYRMKR